MSVTVVETPTNVTVSPGPTVVVENTVIQVVEVTSGVPNPTLIFKTADETNLTTSFTNDDELRFEVEEGALYWFDLTVIVAANNDAGGWQAAFDWPSDAVFKGGVLIVNSGSHVTNQMNERTLGDEFDLSNSPDVVQFRGLIDATAAGAGGEVVFQFRNPDGNVAGGVTVKAGSFIELFKVT